MLNQQLIVTQRDTKCIPLIFYEAPAGGINKFLTLLR